MAHASSALITATERLYYASHRRGNIEDWLVAELGPRAPSDVVLDFGGGDGHISLQLRNRIGGQYLVADLPESALRQIVHSVGAAPVLIPPTPQLPIRTGGLAAAILVDVLHHVHREEETLAELIHCLRPGGVLAIVEFERRHLATQAFGMFARMGGRRCRFHTPFELADIVRAHCLRVTVKRLDGLRYGVSARR